MIDKVLLFPYYLTLVVRHALYDSGVRKSVKAEVPTICVGNITAGGTGKTPHTEMILRTLLQSDEWAYSNIAVLSRGYRRHTRGFQQVPMDGTAYRYGDEPTQIKKKFPAVTVAVDKNRIQGCDFLVHPDKLQTSRKARRCTDKNIAPTDVIVLDDAFQYRKLKATVNIVLVDYNRPIFNDLLVPFGHLRDLKSRIKAADIIIVTKCPSYLDEWEKTNMANALGVKNYSPVSCKGTNKAGEEQTVLFSEIGYVPMKPVFENGDTRYIYSKKLILVTGIAKDKPLRQYLSDTYKIIRSFSFHDHHQYSTGDIRSIYAATRVQPTAVVVTTEKDSQRILDAKKVPEILKTKMFQVPMEVNFLTDGEKAIFETTLLSFLRGFHSEPEQTHHE